MIESLILIAFLISYEIVGFLLMPIPRVVFLGLTLGRIPTREEYDADTRADDTSFHVFYGMFWPIIIGAALGILLAIPVRIAIKKTIRILRSLAQRRSLWRWVNPVRALLPSQPPVEEAAASALLNFERQPSPDTHPDPLPALKAVEPDGGRGFDILPTT